MRKEGADRRQRQDMIDGTGTDRRAGHDVHFGGFGILYHAQTSHALDLGQSDRAIGTGADQDNTHELVAEGFRRSFEQNINRGTGKVDPFFS